MVGDENAKPDRGATFARLGCHSWLDDAALSSVAAAVAAVLYEGFSVLGRREEEVFDPTTGVLHGAYPGGPYRAIPAVDNADVQAHFDAYVDRDSGDALLLLERLDDVVETLAPRSDARFGIPFDQRCELLVDM